MSRKLSALLLCVCFSALPQSDRGNITGTVTDPTGAAVLDARIVIINRATNSSITASATQAGDYNAPSLSPGSYRIEITSPGFKRFVQDNLALTASGTVRLDAQLQLGQVSDTVEVSTAIAQIQTDNAKISTSVQNMMVDELPLVAGGAMRSPFDLVTITPESKGSGGNLSLGGGQAAAWDATLDGVSVTTNRSANTAEIAYNTPLVEAITEFTVDTNGFKAEYGQAGGGVMTFVSKSARTICMARHTTFYVTTSWMREVFSAHQIGVQSERFWCDPGRPCRHPEAVQRQESHFLLPFVRRFPQSRGSETAKAQKPPGYRKFEKLLKQVMNAPPLRK